MTTFSTLADRDPAEAVRRVHTERAAALDRVADLLLGLGQVQRAELLAHRAQAIRAEPPR
jgi:hypothetical protein